ncbi:MAG: ABC transporter permease [Planctomycetes bacterium]|nr:ABC transporter permease [Planctomycetota bacterium]MCB9885893.1 ABC transporter permease [Planctomycetota bacterium]
MTLVRHYDAAAVRRGMLSYVLPMFGYPGLVWRNRYMIQNFLRRELLGRFHGSFLGVWWILAQPLFQFTVYYFVFGVLFAQGRGGNAGDAPYAVYLFSGVILFHSLVEATTQSCSVVVANGNLVKKVAFPSELLVLPVVLSSLVLYLVGAAVCVVAGVWLDVLHPGLLLLALPLVLLIQLVYSTGLGLLLANLDVFVRDTSQLWRVLTMAWMFLTPVFWEPKNFLGLFGEHEWVGHLLFNLNSAYPLLMAQRILIGLDDPLIGPQLGDFWTHVGVASLWAAIVLVLGYTSFVSRKHKYADLI